MSGSQKYHVETCIKTLSDVGELIQLADWFKHLVLHSPPVRDKCKNMFADANFLRFVWFVLQLAHLIV